MADQRLCDYIKKQLQQGVEKSQIVNALTSAGWSTDKVEEAFAALSQPTQSLTIPLLKMDSLLKDSWQILKSRFLTLFGLLLLNGLVSLLYLPAFLLALSVANLIFSSTTPQSLIAFLLLIALAIIIGLLIFLALAALTTWAQLAFFHAVAYSSEKIGVRESFKRAWSKILPFIWLYFLESFLVFGGLFPFLVPGIIFFIWFLPSIYIFILEGERGMNTLLKSREYVRRRWRSVVWSMALFFIFIFILNIISSTLTGLFDVQGTAGILYYLTLIFKLVTFAFTYAFGAIYLYTIYRHLKVAKGEFVFVPSRKTKITYIAVASVGLLILFILFILGFFPLINTFRSVPKPAPYAPMFDLN